MKKQISVILCAVWNGTDYSREAVEAFYDYSNAEMAMNSYQGRNKKCDVEYYIEAVDIGDSV